MRIFLCIVLLGLAGCVPFVTYVDYRPQMQEGIVSADHCLGYERVAYQIDGVKITSRLDQHVRKQPNLHTFKMFLTIPDGESAAFLSDRVVVEKLRDGVMLGAPIDAYTGIISVFDPTHFGASGGSLESLGVMLGHTTLANNGAKIARLFSIRVGLETMPESDYRIMLPAMDINGKSVMLPPILFTRAARVKFIVPINC